MVELVLQLSELDYVRVRRIDGCKLAPHALVVKRFVARFNVLLHWQAVYGDLGDDLVFFCVPLRLVKLLREVYARLLGILDALWQHFELSL